MAAAALLSRWRDCGGRRCFSFFFLFVLCFFSFFFFSFPLFFLSYSLCPLSSLFCRLSSLFCYFSSLPSLSLSFFFCSPVFIGKNKGDIWTGRTLCCRPSTSPPTRGKWLASFWKGSASFWKESVAVTKEEKIFFFPCFTRPGEEEDSQCRSKWHCFGLSFFW